MVQGITTSHGLPCRLRATVTADGVTRQAIIYALFILSAIGIAWTDRLIAMPAIVKHPRGGAP